MAGSKLAVDLMVSEARNSGAPGGASLQVKGWSTSVTQAQEQLLELSGSPVTIALPVGGAHSLSISVETQTAPFVLTINGNALPGFTGGFSIFSDASGGLITSASITGTGSGRALASA